MLSDGFRNSRTLVLCKNEASGTVNDATNKHPLIVELAMHEGPFPLVRDDKETAQRNWKGYDGAGGSDSEFRVPTCATVQHDRSVAGYEGIRLRAHNGPLASEQFIPKRPRNGRHHA